MFGIKRLEIALLGFYNALSCCQKKKGMHSLRHTLASRLLAENTPLPLISDILGHISSDSTAVYLKVDVSTLRECALNPEGVLES